MSIETGSVRVPSSRLFYGLKIYFAIVLLFNVVVIALLVSGVILIEKYVKQDVMQDTNLSKSEKKQLFATLTTTSIIVSSTVVVSTVQILIGWIGIAKLNGQFLTVYGILDLVSAALLVALACYLTKYRVIMACTAVATVIHMAVPIAITREIRRTNRLTI